MISCVTLYRTIVKIMLRNLENFVFQDPIILNRRLMQERLDTLVDNSTRAFYC